MRLVSKGQKEAELEEENRKKRNGQRDQAQADYDKALSKAKEDAEMLEKSFLQEAQSTINTQLERPSVGKINSKEDEMTFMCIDIDFYIDTSVGITWMRQWTLRLCACMESMRRVIL